MIKAREPMRMITRRGPLYSLVTMFQSLRNSNLHYIMLLFSKLSRAPKKIHHVEGGTFLKLYKVSEMLKHM